RAAPAPEAPVRAGRRRRGRRCRRRWRTWGHPHGRRSGAPLRAYSILPRGWPGANELAVTARSGPGSLGGGTALIPPAVAPPPGFPDYAQKEFPFSRHSRPNPPYSEWPDDWGAA